MEDSRYRLRILHLSDLHERGPREGEPWRKRRVLGLGLTDGLGEDILEMTVVPQFGERILLGGDDDIAVGLGVLQRQRGVVGQHHDPS